MLQPSFLRSADPLLLTNGEAQSAENKTTEHLPSTKNCPFPMAQKTWISVHETGHIMMALILEKLGYMELTGATIIPDPTTNYLAVVSCKRIKKSINTSLDDYLSAHILFDMSGSAAERTMFNQDSFIEHPGLWLDMKSAFLTAATIREPTLTLEERESYIRDPENIKALRRIVEEHENKAYKLLSKHPESLLILSAELATRETMSGQDIRKFMTFDPELGV